MKKKFFELLTEIAYGLVNKELAYENMEKDENYYYFQQQELIKSIQKLALFMLEHRIVDDDGIPIAPNNETEAIIYYFSKPLDEWPCAVNPAFNELKMLADDEEVLVHVYENDTFFYTTEWCKELADQCHEYNQNAMQQAVYQKLMQVTEEQYRFLRKFIIEQPILDVKASYDFKRTGKISGLNEMFLDEFIKVAYEPLPANVLGKCRYCGWTVIQSTIHSRCIDSRCKLETDGFFFIEDIVQPNTKMRLKSGVMKYICLPGKDELELIKYCQKLRLQTILWPDKDRYDVRIETKSGVLAIDIKSYYSPYSLAYHIEQNGLFNRLNEDERPILVIPDHRIRKQGYLEIVKHTLSVYKNIQCINVKQLKKLLREEVKNGDI
ncbi:hypothetical protein MHB44_07135 [Lysinibacillus sp. FSL H8-0500]|uniref:restriction endonuclease-related protein n=1 Tax=Lysinibacillus sp. FSL H8-0500 TaxID=2921393 RepID=UPI0031012BA7